MINKIDLAVLLFLIAGFSDFFDGYMARYLKQETLLGANMDLLADKIFVCSLLIFLSFHYNNFIFVVMTILIVARELSIGTIRQYSLETNKQNKSKVNFLGKFKTFFQIFTIGVSFIFFESQYEYLIELSICITAIISWISLINYLYAKN